MCISPGELLKKSLNSKLPKDKYIITKPYGFNNTSVYLSKLTSKRAVWSHEKLDAKIFHYENDAMDVQKCFSGSNTWTIEKLI